MGQSDVYEWLRNQRLSGNNEYFSVKQVVDNLHCQNGNSGTNVRSVWKQLRSLDKFGYIETVVGWPSYFRVKSKFVKKK